MKKRMRYLSILLAVIMVMSLAACGGTSGGSTNPGNAGTASSAKTDAAKTDTAKTDTAKTETTTPATDNGASEADENTNTLSGVIYGSPEEILSRDYSEHMKLEYAGIQLVDGFDYTAGNEYLKWWSDTFNIEWDVTSLTFENWAQRMNTWLNADDIPEWCVWNFNAGDIINYAEQDIIKRMPDDWKERWPNLAASQTADLVPYADYYDNLLGGTYVFFRPVMGRNFPAHNGVTTHMGVHLRRDWAEQVGFDLSECDAKGTITLDQIIDYCRKVKEAGIVEYPFVGTTGHFMNLADMNSDHTGMLQSAYYIGDDGLYHWGPAEEENHIKDNLTKLKTMFDEGLVYPDFYTILNDDDQPYFNTSGQAAVIFGNGMPRFFDECGRVMPENLGVDYYEVGAFYSLVDENNVYHADKSANFFATNILSPYISEDHFERLMSMWDYSCTKEGQDRIRMGVRGVDFDYDENGELVNLLADTFGSISAKYNEVNSFRIYHTMVICSDDFGLINPAFDPRAREISIHGYMVRDEIGTHKDRDFDFDLASYSSQAMNLATMTYTDEYANLVTKSGDFSANYDQWVQEKLQLVQPVLDELNAKFRQ